MKCTSEITSNVDGWPSGIQLEETAKRTRSMTAIYGLERLQSIFPDDEQVISPTSYPHNSHDVFCRAVYAVHVVGADYVEARSDALSMFVDLTHWIARYHYRSVIQRHSHITVCDNTLQEVSVVVEYLLVGPSLPVQFNGMNLEETYYVPVPSADSNTQVDFNKSILVKSKLLMISSLYDTYMITAVPGVQEQDSSLYNAPFPPSFYLLYHPGIWGYDSWKPTLKAIQRRCGCTFHRHHIHDGEGDYSVTHSTPPIFVTSFNQFEAEDDCECIDVMLIDSEDSEEGSSGIGKSFAVRWLFKSIPNPFASRVKRQSHGIEGRVCIENSFINCFVGTFPTLDTDALII